MEIRMLAAISIMLILAAYAQHGDSSPYSVGPANHFLQDMYSADGVEADSDNDGAIDNSNNLQAAGGTAEVFSPLGGGVLLRIDGSVGSSSYLQFMKGGAQQWTVGKNAADEFIIDRVGAVNVIRINNARDMGIGNPAAITERLTVNGGISITDDPDSDDDLFDRGYANLNFVNEGQAASISNGMLQNNAVTSIKIQDGTIISVDIADGVITTADIDTASFDARYVNEGQVSSVTTGMIVDSTIQSVDIADGVIQSVDIADGAIAVSDLNLVQLDARYVNEGQAASISTAMLQDASVTNAKVNDVSWTKLTGVPAGLNDGDQVGLLAESDPTVPASVKDGIHWDEIAGKPAGFVDGIDNTGGGATCDWVGWRTDSFSVPCETNIQVLSYQCTGGVLTAVAVDTVYGPSCGGP